MYVNTPEGGGNKVKNVGEGVFVLASYKDKYHIRVGNIAKTEDANMVINNLNEFNSLDPDTLKIKYRELIKSKQNFRKRWSRPRLN